MISWFGHPAIDEINARAWLGKLSRKYQRPQKLATVLDTALYADLKQWQCHLFQIRVV
jgi:G:T-mismatch repair DNA endonuclease (very short patch repair protein)